VFVIFALGGCAGQGPTAPYSHDSGPDMRSM